MQPRLTPEERRQVVALYDADEPMRDIAAAFGISVSAVGYLAATRTTLRRDKPIAHGTRKGHQQHKARGVPLPENDSCGCRAANNEYMRNYTASKKKESS